MDQSALAWQKQLYLEGFAGRLPLAPIDYDGLECAAREVMTPRAFAYVAGGAGNENTITENRKAFERYCIVPRMLRDVGERDAGISIFGHKLPSPFLLSPVGVLELAHEHGDLAVARAASELHIPFIFSNQASFTMEACSAEMNGGPRWFQLYWSKSNELVASFIKRAEACHCSAIVVTLDTTMLGWRTRDLAMGYLPFLEGRGIAQYTSDPVFQKMIDADHEADETVRAVTWQSLGGLISMVNRYPGKGFLKKLRSGRPLKAVRKFISCYSNPRTTWQDLRFLRTLTSLPIVLKGILHPDDARMAADAGMDGVIVSNHGGRQVDGCISTLQALTQIAEAVPGNFPVILDSGIRGGADAFKAIALGAKAVCIGRPYVYGLALAGKEGVSAVLRNYMADFELTMALAGCKNVKEISRQSIIAN
jgi:lactate 2-monooxygenase